ncbi:unnamed protein product [Acanthoscelides obtectus]|uniref:Tc1-like transposase DDE domain-containing protein n=1 Tax=Acanthoscelides obtectus TaxID=200917 RepID=A0A9P0M3C2_ACAOB|nr:unnamed protein product [Acanthoscelides obtectus]CAK1641046.1 Histone-lysine N-methyltransferase SETMAR [Acanthoscelides obtectus]
MGAPHHSTISRWYVEFKLGRVILSDDARVGAPKTAVTQENVDAVRKLIIEDRHMTYRKIEASKKLVSRWIPLLLTEEQKAARVNWCQKTLDHFNSGNKTGHIATIPLNEKRTVTADRYTTICLPKVITELRKINPERRIILHQDDASSHTAQKTRQYLTEENVELLDHPPYSPDLSPNDFFTVPKIKNRLRGQRFQSPEEAVDAFKNAVLDLPANEWKKCFENWFERMQMCINLREILFRVEKYFRPHDLLTLYKAQIRPSLQYCSHVWGAATLSMLDAVQRRAVRLIDDSYLTDTGRRVGDLALFYRYTNGLCSSELSSMMPPPDVPARQTCLTLASNPNRVELRTSRTGRCDHSFVPREAFPSSTNLGQLKNRIHKSSLGSS